MTMHRSASTLTCLLVLLFQTTLGQDATKVQEPDKYGFFYYQGAGSSSLLLLERQAPQRNKKNKAMGLGGFSVSVEIKGGKSPLRFTSNQELVFFVRMFQTWDFAGIGQLTKTEAKNDKRIISTTAVGTDGHTSNSPFDPNPRAIPYKADKYVNETFRITPAKVLEPGEYCFQGISTVDFFCFGIDPAETKEMKSATDEGDSLAPASEVDILL